MICTCCRSEMRVATRTREITFKGTPLTIENDEYTLCNCGEGYYNAQQWKEADRKVKEALAEK